MGKEEGTLTRGLSAQTSSYWLLVNTLLRGEAARMHEVAVEATVFEAMFACSLNARSLAYSGAVFLRACAVLRRDFEVPQVSKLQT